MCRNLPALLQTLQWYQNKDSNPTAIGLLKKLKKPDFIGVLYILKCVLPVLSTLRCFKRAPYLFLIFLLPSKHLKIRLSLVQENITVKEFLKETKTGKLACLEFSEDEIKKTEAKMHDLCDSLDRQYRSTRPALFASRFILPYLRSTFHAY